MSRVTRQRAPAVPQVQEPPIDQPDDGQPRAPQIPPVLLPFLRLLDPFIQILNNFVGSARTQRFVIKTIFIIAALFTVFGAAFLGYASFYYAYVPEVKHVQPVWLQYSSDSVPIAYVDLSRNGKYAKPLRHEQAYLVSIDLDLPTSQRNLDVGNFMVSVWLQNAMNETVQYSSRPTMLKYQSPLTRVLYTLWRAIPLILDFSQESQRLKVTLIESFHEDEANPITKATISISDSRVQVYEAKLRLDADFRGIRYFMYYWRLTSAAFFISVFLFWEFLFGILAWRLFGRTWWARLGPLDEPIPKLLDAEPRGDGEGDDDDYEDDFEEEVWQPRSGFETDSDAESILPRTQGQPSAGSEALASLTTAYRQQQIQQQHRALALQRQHLQQQQQQLQRQQEQQQQQQQQQIAAATARAAAVSAAAQASLAAGPLPLTIAKPSKPARQPSAPSASTTSTPAQNRMVPSENSVDSEFTTQSDFTDEDDDQEAEFEQEQQVPPTPSTVTGGSTDEYTDEEEVANVGQSSARTQSNVSNLTRRGGGANPRV
ncbi:hypothetical protein BC937DRAFT_92771 [Endogone sp. FLAS-F59071]|nr:hypothetical protein BC937DRAFT_92771 [Endogone sp. FLAS-F59071]|eukprot:RUS15196.1 hypothetical protein BC937DRAFT_92771 [Endogone sp. FLAS-F59071]